VDNPYLELTREFNRGRLRAILSSGQAVVLYRLAVMSKDGDWILREDDESLRHVLAILSRHGARYRLGAPLDLRWLRAGWSSHFEYFEAGLRLRADFVTRPPRTSPPDLAGLWAAPEIREVPVVDLERLAELKKTDREKDYAVIGELARLMTERRAQLLYSRSARDLMRLAREAPEALAPLIAQRPLLAKIGESREAIERALDEERRELMRSNEERLARYFGAAEAWTRLWPEVHRQVAGLSLAEAHAVMTARAEAVLPTRVD
jgi:hypothetical protein